MDVSTAIRTRRAVKHFDPDHRMQDAEIDRLLELTLLSPTAFNIQHWRFVVVSDPDLRQRLRAVTWMQPQVTDASLLVILCAGLKAWAKAPERCWRNAPGDVQEGVLGAIREYYDGREQAQRDEAVRSCALAAQTLMLAATAMGYESCLMDLTDLEEVGRLINLPRDHIVTMYVAIGKGLKAPWPRGGQLPMREVVIKNRFDDPL